MFKYYIKYYGCAMNRADAEKLVTIFDLAGFEKTKDIDKADIITLLACSVRQTAVDRIYGAFHKKKLKKVVIKILTGCVLDQDFKKLQDRFDIIIDITKIKKLPKLIKERQQYYQYCPGDNEYLKVNSQLENKWEQLIPISNGCNQFCTYCAVPYTRGREVNRSASNILQEVKNLGPEVKQIILLGQTVNSYVKPVKFCGAGISPSVKLFNRVNPDKNSKVRDFALRQAQDFADLLEQVAILKPDAWITFLSPYPTKFNLKLIKIIAKYDNISKHIHLPLQSGSDKILKLMNRKYNMKQFYKIVEQIYKYIPQVNLTSDIIVGFSEETKIDFKRTLQAIKKCKFTLIYTGLYSPRPGTVSAKIYKDEISKAEKRKRDEEITKLVGQISKKHNERFLNTTQKVLVQKVVENPEWSRGSKDFSLGKMQNYETVKISNFQKEDLGKFIKVKINKALDWGLEGERVKGKLVVVLGPTACGKTKIGVSLAKKFNGEIISADSRQVYKWMDIGTGKDLKDYQGVPYHLIDTANPKEQVSLKDWQNLAFNKIKELNEKNKLPILVGGTGLYLNSIIDGYVLEDIEVDQKLRKELNKLSLKQLQNKLKKLDKDAFKKIDVNNPRRIIRAIEIAQAGNSITKMKKKKPDLDVLVLGIKFDKETIYKRIDKRLKYRIEKEKMIPEVRNLRQKGVSWKRLDDFGLEYRWVVKYLKKEINKEELFNKLSTAIHHFAKRQLTWFKKRKDIVWIKNVQEVERLVKRFLKH